MTHTFVSKTGTEITLRYPTLDDAAILMEYINLISQERTYITYQGEHVTLEEETAYVKKLLDSFANHTGVYLLALAGDKLIGSAGIDMGVRTEKHIGLFGISLHKDYREQGIGTVLMDTVIEEALATIPQLEILTLSVFGHNGRACHLYEKLGFTRYGLLPNGVKLEDGYADHVYMYKNVRET